MRALANCLRRCKQLGVLPTRQIVIVLVAGQRLTVIRRTTARSMLDVGCWMPRKAAWPPRGGFTPLDVSSSSFPCSTSRFGIGQTEGSNCTPLGLHRIVEKIGGGWPVGTVFKSRKPIGFTWQGMPDAKITTRILWLEGLEPGFNRGGNVDSHARYIYIHGTGDELTIGRPASCGCIHLAANDLIPLFDRLPTRTLVWIER